MSLRAGRPRARILTTTVGSYPVPDWLAALPSEQALLDATRVVFNLQRQAGIDLPTDGELYRFDVNHPDTNGMIEYFVHQFGGMRREVGPARDGGVPRESGNAVSQQARRVSSPARSPKASLNLPEDCARAASVAGGPFKFTLTSPYMLARTLLDEHYHDFAELTLAIADALAAQVADSGLRLRAGGRGEHSRQSGRRPARRRSHQPRAGCRARRESGAFLFRQLRRADDSKRRLGGADFISQPLRDRPSRARTRASPAVRSRRAQGGATRIGIGLGVVDIKVNHIETPEEIARAIERAEKVLGPDRVRYVHPDCGFWMLKRSVADRKIAALVKGRDLYGG